MNSLLDTVGTTLGSEIMEAGDEWLDKCVEDAKNQELYRGEAINWGDLGIADVELRKDLVRNEPWHLVVVVEEASPAARQLAEDLQAYLCQKFPKVAGNLFVECEW